MPDSGKTVGLICFGPYELSLDCEELRKDGNRLKLSGQAIQVLVVLANNRGKLVTREELQQRLWPGASCGDFEHGLNAAVNRLREILGDSATDPIYIETVPRRGYRFIAQVDQVSSTTDSNVPNHMAALHSQPAANIGKDWAQSAHEIATDLDRQLVALTQPQTSRRTAILVAVIALCVVIGVTAWSTRRNAKIRWARHYALPEIVKLADADRFDEAYRLAQQVQPLIPDDPLLAEQTRAISRRAIIESDPAGGEVFYRPYGSSGDPWRPLGKTPVESKVPRGLMHWKIEMAGGRWRRTLVLVLSHRSFGAISRSSIPTRCRPAWYASHRPMTPFYILMPGLEHLPEVHLPDYWIDRHEVTNRAFKKFVDEGGYRRPELWQVPFVKNGRTLTFEAAMAHFRDKTGRPGPAGWEMSTYLRRARRLSSWRRELVRSVGVRTLGWQVAADDLSLGPSSRPAAERACGAR